MNDDTNESVQKPSFCTTSMHSSVNMGVCQCTHKYTHMYAHHMMFVSADIGFEFGMLESIYLCV